MAKRFFYVCAGLFMLAAGYGVGARNVGAQLPVSQEVAVLSGVIPNGGTIPLPHYQDGSEALENECSWTVSTAYASANPSTSGTIARFQCFTEGRTVRVFSCSGASWGDCTPENAGTANYMIIATRNTSPTPVSRESMGQLKARYR